MKLENEMTSKNLVDVSGKTPSGNNNANKVKEETNPPYFKPKQECYRCSGNHDPSCCKYKNEVCCKCQKKGHMAKVCRGKRKQETGKKKRKEDGKQRTHFVKEIADQDDVYAMYHLSGDRKKSFKVDLELCGRKNAMEIDTGASKTILNEATYGRLRDALGPLPTTKVILSTYTGEKIFLENQDGGWRMEDGGWRMEDRGWRIEDRGSRIEDRGSRIEDQGSRIE